MRSRFLANRLNVLLYCFPARPLSAKKMPLGTISFEIMSIYVRNIFGEIFLSRIQVKTKDMERLNKSPSRPAMKSQVLF
ncbi:MAG TPA: hypothetical protein DDW65_02485 [Firmicutes bacterium]|nr:hypothetical protein [Bacillota bacterium]